ncbi:MAG: ubiquinol-cytochrome c reductase iron-sulfur subunit, partial [Desulfatiglandales bacterium]
ILFVPSLIYVGAGTAKSKEIIISKAELENIPIIKDGLFITKDTEDKFVVLSLKCTHLGCTLNYDRQNRLLVCPCHGSMFNLNGENVKGPAKISLTKPDYKIDNKGNLIVTLVN